METLELHKSTPNLTSQLQKKKRKIILTAVSHESQTLKIKECLHCSRQVPFSSRKPSCRWTISGFSIGESHLPDAGPSHTTRPGPASKKSENGELVSVGLVSLALTIKPALSSSDIQEVGEGVRLSPALMTPQCSRWTLQSKGSKESFTVDKPRASGWLLQLRR